jgi:hypothetical protein
VKIYILTLSLFASSVVLAGEPDPKAGNYWLGYSTNQLNMATVNLGNIVDKVPTVATETGANLMKGLLSECPKDKQMEIGGNLMKGALREMNPEERQQIAYDLSKGALEAGASVAGAGLVMAKDAIVAKTAATAVAAKGAAVAAAPVVAVGTFAAFGIVYAMTEGITSYSTNSFNRCLSTNFNSRALNGNGVPQRCESPERRLAEWDRKAHKSVLDKYKTMKSTGEKPKGEYL